ncbi:MAG: NADH-quinone oxidoreductase subunit J [Burkholderiales bacterium]|jgi:NADH-quinone oxidoreductase subunit J|nr:NADH-quinone oxidoreductase subunit J [Burkholderiales bacterium]MCA3154249.1 NADH-quinone oxidoreductase subunit J [Burkholderiales bacterium]MCA3157178.1 NADH-quinone oxidoreductase subunit J [Burkholderiales bacterium]MCA3159854.1 NADH-quinone oxidoreductase subunit J [Burkholderiales bacterium]MCA3162754.1 NADH-quinone oxidoreductase subunit J [Burkholderiales bacterium]
MEFKTGVFYFFAAILVLSALRVITTRNPVHAALFLVLAFFSASGIWMLLHAEFLAITLVLVYVGAVMVLFLFVVMMLDINIDVLRAGFRKNLPTALLVGGIVIIEMYLVINATFGVAEPLPLPKPADYSNTREVGKLIYTQYVYALQIAALILLVGMIAAIALTLRKRKDSKYQDPAKQVSVKREDRVRLVSMPAVKKDSSEA